MADAEGAPGTTVPTILATEATALDTSRKRKLQDALDLGARDGGETTKQIIVDNELAHEHICNGEHDHSLGENDEGSDESEFNEEEMMENLLDQIDGDPFISDGSHGVDQTTIDRVHAHLRNIGPQEFLQEIFAKLDDLQELKKFGVIFGIDPGLEIPDELFINVLGSAVVRAYRKRQKLSQYNTIDDAAALLERSRNIMVITGAGVSTSLGIPDFRSKGTGFYDKVREMGFDEPEDVFDIEYFDEKPQIFYSLAGEILPDLQRFSPTHAFIRLLQDKDRLQTNYTQNIDNLEAAAGISPDRIIQCHGSFATASCRVCQHRVPGSAIYADIRAKRVPRCEKCVRLLAAQSWPPDRPRPRKRSKPSANWDDEDDDDADDDIPEPGVMKPDITFFGEQLPNTFFDRLTEKDAQTTDLVIVIGTSLKVAPVCEIPNCIPSHVPHIYISLEPIQHINFDIQLLGTCDNVVVELCKRAGWDLRHDMIPDDFEAVLAQVGKHQHVWSVTARGHEEVTKPEDKGDLRDRVQGSINGAPGPVDSKSMLAAVSETSTAKDIGADTNDADK